VLPVLLGLVMSEEMNTIGVFNVREKFQGTDFEDLTLPEKISMVVSADETNYHIERSNFEYGSDSMGRVTPFVNVKWMSPQMKHCIDVIYDIIRTTRQLTSFIVPESTLCNFYTMKAQSDIMDEMIDSMQKLPYAFAETAMVEVDRWNSIAGSEEE
jgi:hypothetical protein